MAKKDWLDRLFDLNSRMFSTEFEAEAAECRKQINKLLKQHGKSTNDIAELLQIVQKGVPRLRRLPHNRSRHPAIQSPALYYSRASERFAKNSSVWRSTNTLCSRCGACTLTSSAALCPRRHIPRPSGLKSGARTRRGSGRRGGPAMSGGSAAILRAGCAMSATSRLGSSAPYARHATPVSLW